ncbi:BQ2448_1681 [Microbotryum intermedium]|uniref:BQ2448_1681 protein n=1 Tax=Microbotryum intermedium TaxID=269621 RepID=A0A238FAU5_9BASI|nr:BQ2448_1681 [Microbotryum intermedium]
MYYITSFTTQPKKGGPTIVHAISLSNVVLKAGRQTIVPARAIALAGFGEDGAANKALVEKMTPKQRLAWLVGEDENLGVDIKVGDIEMGMDGRSEWPGAVSHSLLEEASLASSS